MKNRKIFKTLIFSIIAILTLLALTGCNNNKEQNKLNITTLSKVEFNENECLAIGYILGEDLEEFNKKYFNSTENLKVYDFRSKISKDIEAGDRFILIPKSEDVKISIYRCLFTEEGKLELDSLLLNNYNEPLILLDDYTEYIPRLCVKVKYNDLEEQFYIQFSGEDGKLVLTEVEDFIKDISIYK